MKGSIEDRASNPRVAGVPQSRPTTSFVSNFAGLFLPVREELLKPNPFHLEIQPFGTIRFRTNSTDAVLGTSDVVLQNGIKALHMNISKWK